MLADIPEEIGGFHETICWLDDLIGSRLGELFRCAQKMWIRFLQLRKSVIVVAELGAGPGR